MPEANQLFTEEAVAALIKRAAEIQEGSAKQPYSAGVNEGELVRIAAEMGVDADSLRAAIDEYRTRGGLEAKKSGWRTEVEHVLDRELDPNDFDVVTAEFTTSATERPSQIGRTISARLMTGLSQSAVTVTGRNGRTRVKVSSDPGLGLALAIPPSIISLLVGLPVLLKEGPMVGVPIFLGGAAVATALIWGGWRSARAAAPRIAEQLVQRIQETFAGQPRDEVRAQGLAQQPQVVDEDESQTVES